MKIILLLILIVITLLMMLPQDSFAVQTSSPINLKSGGWESGDHLDIDETERDDSDFMTSKLLKRNKGDIVRFDLEPTTNPLVDTGHVIHYTHREDGLGNNYPYLIITLQQGNKKIAEWTQFSPLPSSFTLATHTLSEIEASAITKYDKLVLKFNARCDATCTNQDTDSVSVSWAVLELPDPVVPPNSPTSLNGVHDDSQVTLTWSAPTDDGGAPISDYIIEYSVDGNNWNVFDDGTNTQTTAIVTGLTNGQQYHFRVFAVNVAGQGTFSNIIISTPVTIPSSPTNLVATPSDARVSLSWSAPTDDGGAPISDYIIEYSVDGNNWNVFDDGTNTQTTAIVTGLTNGQQYHFRVFAVNAIGTGPLSNVDVATPVALQFSHPISLKNGGWASGDHLDIDETTRDDGDFMTSKLLKRNANDPVRFNLDPTTDPLVDTDHIIHYTYKEDGLGNNSPYLVVTLQQGNTEIAEWTHNYPLPSSFTLATQTLTELEASAITKYDKLVLKFNARCDATCTNQDTDSVSVSWAVLELPSIATLPDKPLNVQTVPENSQVILSWTPPAEDGGAPISDYIIEYSVDGNNWNIFNDGTNSDTSIVITGLTNRVDYFFRISATNSQGTGITSDVVSATPFRVDTEARRDPPQIQGIGFYKFSAYKDDSGHILKYDEPLDTSFDQYFPYSKHTDKTDFKNYQEMGEYQKYGIYYDTVKKNTIPPFFAEVNQPIQLQVRLLDLFASTKIEHLSLYASNSGVPITVENSNVEIIFDKGKPLEVKDPNNIFKYVKASTSYEDEWLWVNFDLMFQKPVKSSGILLQSWNEFRDSSFAKIDNIWKITKPDVKQDSLEKIDLTAEVEISHGASNPLCKVNNSCFIPYGAKIIEGGIVTWANVDSFTHSVTSGSMDNHDNKFGYVLFPGETVQHTFSNKGIYNYYCELHPWAKGVVTVYGSDLQKPDINFDESSPTLQVHSSTSAGTLLIENNDVYLSTTKDLRLTVSGHVQQLSASNKVGIVIISPDYSIQNIQSVVNNDGFYSIPIILHKHWLEGTYQIITEYRNNQIAEVSFLVTDELEYN